MPKPFRLPWLVPVRVIVCLSVTGLASGQGVVYVEDDATGANDGSSWCDAYIQLQDALAAVVPPAEIRVAQGVYRPDQGVHQSVGEPRGHVPAHQRCGVEGRIRGMWRC